MISKGFQALGHVWTTCYTGLTVKLQNQMRECGKNRVRPNPPLPFPYRFLNLLLAVLLAGLGCGCDTVQDHSLTYALWNDSRDTSHSRPQADPDLKLFVSETSSDVLVEYSAVSDRSKGVQRHAYFLKAGGRRIAACKPPRFVDVRRAAGLAPIAILNSVPPTNSPAFTTAVFAVGTGTTFAVYRPESAPEFHALPYYQDGIVVNSWGRVALTPFTATVDAVVDVAVIGTVAGVFAAWALCEGQSSWRP